MEGSRMTAETQRGRMQPPPRRPSLHCEKNWAFLLLCSPPKITKHKVMNNLQICPINFSVNKTPHFKRLEPLFASVNDDLTPSDYRFPSTRNILSTSDPASRKAPTP